MYWLSTLFSQSKDKIKGFKSISTSYKLRYRDAFNSFCPCTPSRLSQTLHSGKSLAQFKFLSVLLISWCGGCVSSSSVRVRRVRKVWKSELWSPSREKARAAVCRVKTVPGWSPSISPPPTTTGNIQSGSLSLVQIHRYMVLWLVDP